MRQVVLDTNCIGFEAPLAGNAQRLLLEAARRGQLALVVPELVIAEAVNKWREKVDEHLEKLRGAASSLAAYGVEVDIPKRSEVEQRAVEMENELRRALTGLNCHAPDLPEVDHLDVVKRALNRRQPFDAGGKDGYRDTLLWENVLELVHDDDVILVSDDRRAFAGPDKRTLAPDLALEATKRSRRKSSVLLVTSATEAASTFAAEDDEVRRRVGRLLELASFRTVFREQLETTVEFQELDPAETDALIDGVAIGLAGMSELVNLGRCEIVAAFSIGDDLGLVNLTVDASVGINFFVPVEDARRLEHRGDVAPVQGEWEEISPFDGTQVHLATYRYVRLSVSTAIRLDAGAVDRMELDSVRLIDEAEFADAPPAFDPDEAEFEDPARLAEEMSSAPEANGDLGLNKDD